MTTSPRSAFALAPHAVSLVRPAIGAGILLGLPHRGAAAGGDETVALLPLVLLACASDWLDGELARRSGGGTRAGRVVDNLCDFFFLAFVFAWLAAGSVWSPPVWGRLLRYWQGANWLPLVALLASFGVYFARLLREMASGREGSRSPRGHAAGVANYVLVLAGAVEVLPGVNLGPDLLEPAMLGVVLLNAAAVVENLALLFHPPGDAPKMPA